MEAMKNMMNFKNLDTKKLVVYGASLLFPAVGLVPLGMKYLKIGKWGFAGCMLASMVAIVVLATTLQSSKRRWSIGFTVAGIILLIIMFWLSDFIPTPPAVFFVCYYLVDIIAIIVSVTIVVFSPCDSNQSHGEPM